MIVASWPGMGQEYIGQFCASLRKNHVEVKRVERPWHAAFDTLDVLHIHWPEQIFWNGGLVAKVARSIATIAALLLLKLRGVTLIWSVHNDQPHDASKILLTFWRYYIFIVSSLVDGFVTLSPSTIGVVRRKLPKLAKKPGIFVWHPRYKAPDNLSDDLRPHPRKVPRVEDTFLCFFGFVKRYKGVDDLVNCFLGIEREELYLGIFGAADEEMSLWLEAKAKSKPRLLLNLEWLSEKELYTCIRSSDVVVLPFKSILHSGSLIYALSCGKPVITPVTPYALDIQQMVGQEWVRTYNPPLSEEVLMRMSKKQNGSPNLDFLSIVESGKKLKQYYASFRRRSTSASYRI